MNIYKILLVTRNPEKYHSLSFVIRHVVSFFAEGRQRKPRAMHRPCRLDDKVPIGVNFRLICLFRYRVRRDQRYLASGTDPTQHPHEIIAN